MKKGFAIFIQLVLFLIINACDAQTEGQKTIAAPYESLGWSEQEAAAYVMDKFTFGRDEETTDQIKRLGINGWLMNQLYPLRDASFEKEVLRLYPKTGLSLQKTGEAYPGLVVTLRSVAFHNARNGGKSLRGQINFNEMFGTILRKVNTVDRSWFYEMENGKSLKKPMKKLGFGNFMELMYELAAQKLYRATYSENQLEEKLVDFWFNHFNVSITRINDVANNVLSYERDAIRPHILGSFQDMLVATAQHPAMLTYLDNTISNADKNALVLTVTENDQLGSKRQKPGVNENYARELLELHTLGVDGGYTQQDIEETARILTGWKSSPLLYPAPARLKKEISKSIGKTPHSLLKNGFYFDATRHDAGEKRVLGQTYPAGKNVEEGLQLLKRLADHPSTARHIATKMSTYFLSDAPDGALIAKMAATFEKTGGDLRALLKTMVEAPEFWDKKYRAAKAKSPFEFTVAVLRKSNAKVHDATEVLRYLNGMGQPLFACQPPTGYPTEQSFWLNEAAIAKRIKFAYLIDQNKLAGVVIHRKPGTATAFTAPEFQTR